MKTMTAQEVQEYLKENADASVIDVRETEEVAEGKIPEAQHIPLGEVEARMEELDKSKEHILVCRSGRRSAAAGELLESYGYRTVNMEGGMLDWDGRTE